MIDLKPCPFCGGEAEKFSWQYDSYRHTFKIFCKNCGVATENLPTEKEAIEIWNRRAE